MKKAPYIFILSFFIVLSCSTDGASESDEQDIEVTETSNTYFPAINSDIWETKTLEDLNWSTSQLESLIDFLELQNTKSFIVLHDGKIVIEKYMSGHSQNTPWYWASAGKTLTTTVSGIAQDEGLLNIEDKVSDYIGIGWTSAAIEKENLITCKNLLSMNSGLNDSLGDGINPENLQYIADANTRWAYHNVYVKMQEVVAQASNTSWNNYFNTRLKDKIGMSGSWVSLGDLNVYWSNTRSMARFGLMISANGKWEDSQIISETFLNEATSASQNINQAYGYLWWLNGKSSFRLPQTQFEFQGELIPDAPEDMYCALGKNDQKIYIVPSKKLVVIRVGNAADDDNFALSSFDNELWIKINQVLN